MLKKIFKSIDITHPRLCSSTSTDHSASEDRAHLIPASTRTVQSTPHALRNRHVSVHFNDKDFIPLNATEEKLVSGNWHNPDELDLDKIELSKLRVSALNTGLQIVQAKIKKCDEDLFQSSRGYVNLHTPNDDFQVNSAARETQLFRTTEASYASDFTRLTRLYESLNRFREDIAFTLKHLKPELTPQANQRNTPRLATQLSDTQLYQVAAELSSTHLELAHLIVTARALEIGSPAFKQHAEKMYNTTHRLREVNAGLLQQVLQRHIPKLPLQDPVIAAIPESVWMAWRKIAH